jgi:hypothetical protein
MKLAKLILSVSDLTHSRTIYTESTTAGSVRQLSAIYGRSPTLPRGHLNVGFALTAVLLWSMPSSRSFAESTTNQPRKRCSCVSIRYSTVSSSSFHQYSY